MVKVNYTEVGKIPNVQKFPLCLRSLHNMNLLNVIYRTLVHDIVEIASNLESFDTSR